MPKTVSGFASLVTHLSPTADTIKALNIHGVRKLESLDGDVAPDNTFVTYAQHVGLGSVEANQFCQVAGLFHDRDLTNAFVVPSKVLDFTEQPLIIAAPDVSMPAVLGVWPLLRQNEIALFVKGQSHSVSIQAHPLALLGGLHVYRRLISIDLVTLLTFGMRPEDLQGSLSYISSSLSFLSAHVMARLKDGLDITLNSNLRTGLVNFPVTVEPSLEFKVGEKFKSSNQHYTGLLAHDVNIGGVVFKEGTMFKIEDGKYRPSIIGYLKANTSIEGIVYAAGTKIECYYDEEEKKIKVNRGYLAQGNTLGSRVTLPALTFVDNRCGSKIILLSEDKVFDDITYKKMVYIQYIIRGNYFKLIDEENPPVGMDKARIQAFLEDKDF